MTLKSVELIGKVGAVHEVEGFLCAVSFCCCHFACIGIDHADDVGLDDIVCGGGRLGHSEPMTSLKVVFREPAQVKIA